MPKQDCRTGLQLRLTALLYDAGLQRGQVQPQCVTVKLYFGSEVHGSFFSSSGWENNAALRNDSSSCLMFILQASFLHPLLAFHTLLIPYSPPSTESCVSSTGQSLSEC